MPISGPSLLWILLLNQGPFPPRALPRLVGHTDLSAIPFGPAPSSRTAGSRVVLSTERDFPCCHGTPLANMPSSMPRWTWSVLGSLASCPVSAFPTLMLGRRPHHMVSGPVRCSFALRPACSRTRVLHRAFTLRASNASSLPHSPQLLPAGATVAGWVLLTLPLEFRAFPRRTLTGC